MKDRPLPHSANATHEVSNQPPPLKDYNLYESDACLKQAVQGSDGDWAEGRLRDLGQTLGQEAVMELGHLANRNPPVLRSHDRFGHRIDEVDYHPAWHDLMAIGRNAEIHALPRNHQRPGGQVARAALAYLMNQVESGVCCPFAMTWAAVPVLKTGPEAIQHWLPKLCSPDYDPRPLPLDTKTAATIGMAMTEKQGGSDLRSNATEAKPENTQGPGEAYRLTGHKWFCSAPMSDCFLTLAQSAGGLSCFLVPRWLPDGVGNPFRIQRLKDKLGNRSNASAEIEYDQTLGIMVGDEGRGIATIIEMAQRTRLDVAVCSAAVMRQALVQAYHHAKHRTAFQRRLVDQPLMKAVLTDLALESEAALLLVLRLAQAYDRSDKDPQELAFARVATAIAKFWCAARAPGFVFEAMQCLGGNGYVEESILPRLYREAPLSAIWEGCGNVICLDVLRALDQEDAREALLAELAAAGGLDPELDRAVGVLRDRLGSGAITQGEARSLAETMAVTLQASIMLRNGNPDVAAAFVRSRLSEDQSRTYGALTIDFDTSLILDRILAL